MKRTVQDRQIVPDMTPDVYGRVPMVCESGLAFTKASMSRFVMFVLGNNIGVDHLSAFNANYRGSLVLASLRIRPDQVTAFEVETGGKLRPPPTINLN